jgi:hypothetical protein
MIRCDFGKYCPIATSRVSMIPVFAAALAMCHMIAGILGTYFDWGVNQMLRGTMKPIGSANA